MTESRDTPPRTPSKDESTGYAEKQPRDKGDAHQPAPKPERDPDDGGLDRAPETTPGE